MPKLYFGPGFLLLLLQGENANKLTRAEFCSYEIIPAATHTAALSESSRSDTML